MSEFIEVKTADLIGSALDWALAMATVSYKDEVEVGDGAGKPVVFVYGRLYLPQNEWSVYVTLCERYPGCRREEKLETLRAIVVAMLGNVVSVPAELMA